jgi:hypothetical protein
MPQQAEAEDFVIAIGEQHSGHERRLIVQVRINVSA